MLRYFFDIADGHRFIDPAGHECDDDNSAIEKAKIIAIQVSMDRPAVDPTRHIVVLDSHRNEISTIAVYSKPSAAE